MYAIPPYLKCTGTTTAPLISCGLLLDTTGIPRPEYDILLLQDRTQNQYAEPLITGFRGTVVIQNPVTGVSELMTTSQTKTDYLSTPTVTSDFEVTGDLISQSSFLSKYVDLFTPNLGSTSTKLVGSFLAPSLNQSSVILACGKNKSEAGILKYTYTGSSNSITWTLGNNTTHAPIISTTSTTFSPSASIKIGTRSIAPGIVTGPYTIAPSTSVPKPIVSTNITLAGSTRYEFILTVSNVTLKIGAASGVAKCYVQLGTGTAAFPFTGGVFLTPYQTLGALAIPSDTYGPIMVDFMSSTETLTSTIKIYRYIAATASLKSVWAVTASSVVNNKTSTTVGYFQSNNVNEYPTWIRLAMPDSGGLDWFLTGRLQLVSY